MKPEPRVRGLYKNGARWWVRVNGTPQSTGTTDLPLANRVARMVQELGESPKLRHWLDRVPGDVTLHQLYLARAAGELGVLAAQLDAAAASAGDPDLEPLVASWIADHLPSRAVSPATRLEYGRQIRYFIPAGARFPASSFTEDLLKARLQALPFSGSTKRRYLAPLRLFYRYAKKRVQIPSDPFDDTDWLPANNPPRMRYWDHATVLRVLGHMHGQAQVAMTLAFGTGIELGALLAVDAADIRRDQTLVARGTKNAARRDRTVFIDTWAWNAGLSGYALGSRGRLFDIREEDLREAFYSAQVDAGVTIAPPRSKETGQCLWGRVKPHTIHDARHSYCYTRLLGDDGEPARDLKFCAHQLGHADEQMVMKIYGKLNMEERNRRSSATPAARRGASLETRPHDQ